MSKHRKSWSQSEKMAIINHYKEHGAVATSRQYDVSTGMIYRWVSQFDDKKESTATTSKDLDYHRLLRENQALKEIVAEKELEIRVKSDRRCGCSSKKNDIKHQERMMVAQNFIDQQHPKNKILKWCGVARSSFYYHPKTGIRGRKPYAQVKNNMGQILGRQVVISIIERLFENIFVDYGYYKTYIHLKKKECLIISKHQVYSLMKEAELLRNRYNTSSKKNKRQWVKDLLPVTNTPFDYLEFDIKYVWVAGKNVNVQILTVLDVYSRWQMGHFIAFLIKKKM